MKEEPEVQKVLFERISRDQLLMSSRRTGKSMWMLIGHSHLRGISMSLDIKWFEYYALIPD